MPQMASKILVLNSGSSSLKYKLYERAAQALTSVASGVVERVGDTANSQLISHEAGSNATVKAEVADHTSALKVVLSHIRQSVSQQIEKEVRTPKQSPKFNLQSECVHTSLIKKLML